MRVNKAIIYLLESEELNINGEKTTPISELIEQHIQRLINAEIFNILIISDGDLLPYLKMNVSEKSHIYHRYFNNNIALSDALKKCQGFIGDQPFLLIKNDMEVDWPAPQLYNQLSNDFYIKKHSIVVRTDQEKFAGLCVLRPEIFDYLAPYSLGEDIKFEEALNQMAEDQIVYNSKLSDLM